MYVESRKMVQMNQFARKRHRCREQTYGPQGGKAGWWCWWWQWDELGDWD